MRPWYFVLVLSLAGAAVMLGVGCGAADPDEEVVDADRSGLGEGGGCNACEAKSCTLYSLKEDRRYLTDGLADAKASYEQAVALRGEAAAAYQIALGHVSKFYADFEKDAQNVELTVTADLLMAGADWLTWSSLYNKVGCTRDAYTKVSSCKGAAEGQYRKQLVKKADQALADLTTTGTRTGMAVSAKGLYAAAYDQLSFLYMVPVLGPLSHAGSTTYAVVSGAEYLGYLDANAEEYRVRWWAFVELAAALAAEVAWWEAAIADKDAEIAAVAAEPCSDGSATASATASSGTG